MAGAAMLAGALPPALTPRAEPPAAPARWSDPVGREIRLALRDRPSPSWLAAFYAARDGRPLWVQGRRVRPEAIAVQHLIAGAARDGLDPQAYRPAALGAAIFAARDGDPAALARAELALSRAYGAFIGDLHAPAGAARLAFRDPALPAPTDARGALEAAARARDLTRHLADARRMHPIYEALRAELAARGPSDPLRPLILANMARARALPADPGRRYILVDTAAQQVWLYEDGRVADTMRAIVGTPRAQTPSLAGLMRYARFRPYWNVPPDIVRDEIAPHVLREGVAYVAREELQVLSDWTREAQVLDPAAVDWSAVASGATTLRVRRLPGANNILGQVKLMLPNPLGIYLHDTPNKGPFGWDRRLLSHGCIRLEDARRLARRLIGPAADAPPPGDDVRVDLAEAVPVYVIYLTLAPGPDGLERRDDVYGRDAPLMAEIGAAAPG